MSGWLAFACGGVFGSLYASVVVGLAWRRSEKRLIANCEARHR